MNRITFNPPIKLKFCSTEEQQGISGLWKYFDTYLVIHETGYTDIKVCSEEAVIKIKERLNEMRTSV